MHRLAIAVLAALPWPAAAGPAIDRIEPPGARQGTTLTIAIAGNAIDEPRELWFEEGRIAVSSLSRDEQGVVHATLAIPADCPLGAHRLRLRTAEGLSGLRTFRVHPFEQVAEKEPDDSFEAAQPVAAGVTVAGVVTGEDIDTFKIRLPAGGRFSAVLDGIRLDQEMFDPHLELVDADGFAVATCDDHPLLGQDAAISATVEREGDYFLRVRESSYGGGPGCVYLLHTGSFAIPHVAWPPGGAAGAELDVEWIGDPAGPFRQKLSIPPPRLDGTAMVRPVRDGAASAMEVPMKASSSPLHLAAEPDDDPAKAAKVSAPCAIAGRMEASEDVDWIRVEAAKGTTWQVTGWGRRLGSPIDLVVAAHRANDKRERITSNDDTDGPDSAVKLTVPDEGAFLLRLNDHQRRGGPGFVYWIEVEPAKPTVNLSVSPARSNTQERLVPAVPRGNRMALFFNAARSDCGDEVRVECDGLPAGVAATLPPLPPGAPGALVVFEAAADAPPATALATMRVLRGEGASAEVVGGLRQTTELVFGNPNNATYRQSLGDRLAVAVVEEAPATIELEQPPVPIVRRGQMDLKVKVHRKEGFTGRIRLELPFKPPGIGATGVEVKPEETEVVVPINATADAAIATWRIAVAASLPASEKAKGKEQKGGGERWIASRPVTLTVAEPLIELAADKAVAELGSETKLVYKLAKPAAFEGVAKATLVGLPAKTEANGVELAAGADTIAFPVKVAADAPVGKHDVLCRVEVPMNGGWVTHQAAAASLRIDKPLPPPAVPAEKQTP